MSDTSEAPDLTTPDDVVEGAALEQLGRDLDLGLDLTPEEQVDFDANIQRLRRLGYGEVEPEQPDTDEEDEEEELEEPPPPPEPDGEEPPPPPPAPVAVTPPATFDIAGQQVSAAEARNLLELQNYLRANPAVAQQFSDLVARQQRGEPLTPPPPPQEDPLPEWIDEDDTPAVAMYREQQSLRREMAELRAASVAAQQQAAAAQERTEALSAINEWTSSHPELNEDAVDKVRTEAASLRIIPGLISQYGAVAPAVAKALDLAYYSMPEFRPSQPDPAPKAAERKRKISSISGSSAGSIRSTKPKPLSYEEMRVEAAKFIAENDLG